MTAVGIDPATEVPENRIIAEKMILVDIACIGQQEQAMGRTRLQHHFPHGIDRGEDLLPDTTKIRGAFLESESLHACRHKRISVNRSDLQIVFELCQPLEGIACRRARRLEFRPSPAEVETHQNISYVEEKRLHQFRPRTSNG